MLFRFPPTPAETTDPTFLKGKTQLFAKLKQESKPGKRTVLMTEHTLIFVLQGRKLLHLPDQTLTASPTEVILLRKGIYAMAEYIEAGLDFEALMLFLPGKLLQSMASHAKTSNNDDHCLVFPTTPLIDNFKENLRHYFTTTPSQIETLLPLKQQEALLLLLSGPHAQKVQSFLSSAISSEPADIDYIVNSYLFQPVTIASLAGLANCSLAKFKRDFQQRHGCSPRTWIIKQRLAHAAMLLHNTPKQVAEISLECGFENVSHFIRLFKKE
jgi:AraC-like DNA-binding protein